MPATIGSIIKKEDNSDHSGAIEDDNLPKLDGQLASTTSTTGMSEVNGIISSSGNRHSNHAKTNRSVEFELEATETEYDDGGDELSPLPPFQQRHQQGGGDEDDTYRAGEFGVIGAEQRDETHYDKRRCRGDDFGDESEDDEEEDKSRIQFSKRKLYGRDEELNRLQQIFDDCVATNTYLNKKKKAAIFLSGYSGCGKSALVHEFVNKHLKDRKIPHLLLCGKYDELRSHDPFSGITNALKRWCQQLTEKDILSLQYLRNEMEDMIGADDIALLTEMIPPLNKIFASAEAEENRSQQNPRNSDAVSFDAASLSSFLSCSRLSRSTAARSRGCHKMNQTRIKYIFQCFIKALTSSCLLTSRSSHMSTLRSSFSSSALQQQRQNHQKPPLIMYIDDLQWADDASLELLLALLSDVTITNFIFVGAYRSNEMYEDHPLSAIVKELQDQQQQQAKKPEGEEEEEGGNASPAPTCNTTIQVEMMELSELQRDHVGEFIADTLDLSMDEVSPLTDAIFSKSLGNVFFTMQAMEQLARKNILYYDTMFFVWQWNLSTKNQLQEQLSEDIIDMVKSKIEHNMPPTMQQALVVASYIRSTFDIDTLHYVLFKMQNNNSNDEENKHNNNNNTNNNNSKESSGSTLDKNDLLKYMDGAVVEGLLIEVSSADKEYAFAHDRIQEAARSFLDADEREKNKLLLRVGNALADRGADAEHGEDWMLFTAATHLNAVPSHYYENEFVKVKVAQLNLLTAQLSTGVAGFKEAAKALRAGIGILGDDRWTEQHYDLTLELYNHLLDVEFGLGNCENLGEGIDEVLAQAKTLKDKGNALVHSVGIISISKDRCHTKLLRKAKEVLFILGIDDVASIDMDDAKPADLKKQDKLCKEAMGRYKIEDLFDFPSMEDETALILIEKMMDPAVMSGRFPFVHALSRIALRICFQRKQISPLLPTILCFDSLYLRKAKPTYKQSYEVALECQKMLDRIPEVTSSIRCKVKFIVYNGGLVLMRPLRPSVEAFLESHEHAIKCGDTFIAFIAAMCYGWAYFACGRTITALTETKFALYEEECQQFRQQPSVYVSFSIQRQFVLNIQGKSPNSLLFNGKAMTEKGVLANFDPDSSSFKQTLRDTNILKLIMACVLGDVSAIEASVDILKVWPEFDLLYCRGYTRLLWVSLGCFELARAGRDKSYLAEGKRLMKFFQDEARKGNPNEKVAFVCLQAESKQTKKNYDIAIKESAEVQMIHVQALMNERCGLCQLERKKQQHAEAYLTKAKDLYCQWGATAKVDQMKKEHLFLR